MMKATLLTIQIVFKMISFDDCLTELLRQLPKRKK